MSTAGKRAARRIERLYGHRPDAVELARLASLAVRVEPHLLRELRRSLLPHVDVGTEADLWFCPLVESRGAGFVVLDPAVAAVLRADLAGEPELLDRVRAITRDAHAHAAPSLRLEEELHYLGLGPESGRAEAIDEALRPALRSLAKGGDDALDLAHWALRALPRLFPGVLETPNGFALAMAAQAMLGPIVPRVAEIEGSLESVAWAIPPGALSETTSLYVELMATGLRFGDAGPEERRLELPRTTPLLVAIAWSDGEDQRSAIVQAEPGRTVDLGAEVAEVELRTLAGDAYVLERQAAAGGRRRACYVAQGTGARTDDRTGLKLDLDRSYEVIRNAVEAAGLQCLRAGDLDRPDTDPAHAERSVYEILLDADLVIADLSAGDPDALYELGIRHALRPSGTLAVAWKETELTFDPTATGVLRYGHLSDVDDAEQFHDALAERIGYSLAGEVDSPLYAALPDLEPPRLAGDSEESPDAAAPVELAVEMLPARHGMSLLFSYGAGDAMSHLLVDAGPAPADDLRERLAALEEQRLELLVVTHVDDDRIKGAIHLLEDPDRSLEIDDFWFNGDQHLEEEATLP